MYWLLTLKLFLNCKQWSSYPFHYGSFSVFRSEVRIRKRSFFGFEFGSGVFGFIHIRNIRNQNPDAKRDLFRVSLMVKPLLRIHFNLIKVKNLTMQDDFNFIFAWYQCDIFTLNFIKIQHLYLISSISKICYITK